MNTRQKIPATVISGFLGAGKTSLIRNLLTNDPGRRIALIINEFGDLGLDEQIIRGQGGECDACDIIELANGCICCTVADDFLPTIEALLARDPAPEHIVIETSGLALPKPLVAAFNWPEVRNRVTVDGVIAVVDGPAYAAGQFAADPEAVAKQRAADDNLDHESPLEEVFEDQLACADLVLLNKCDLLSDGAREAAVKQIGAGIRAGVKLVSTTHAVIDAAVLLGIEAAAEDDLATRPSHHDDVEGGHDHDDFESFLVDLGPIADPLAFEDRLRQTVQDHDILRIKGFLDVPGKRRRHVVQGVGTRFERYYDRDWQSDEARRSRLVVIGLRPLNEAAIRNAIGG